MVPTNFIESNKVFDKPLDMSRDECEALSVFKGQTEDNQPVIISCWKPTVKELREINRTGRVWCYHYGNNLQPHALSGTNPFKKIT